MVKMTQSISKAAIYLRNWRFNNPGKAAEYARRYKAKLAMKKLKDELQKDL